MSELVKIPHFSYGSVGSFGIWDNNKIDWEICRDRFQTKSENIKSFLFYHENNAGDNTIDFIRTFEQACLCPHDQDLVIKKTTHANVLYIEISEWWKYRVRRSLMTALLRCGKNYTQRTGESFVNAINSSTYLAKTKIALDYFMSGRTACKMRKNESFQGWWCYFSSKPKSQIEKILVKSRKRREVTEKAC